MTDCPHDLAERETACADGVCPLCLQQEVKRLGTAYDDLLIEAALLKEALEKIANGSTAYANFWQRDIALAALRRKG